MRLKRDTFNYLLLPTIAVELKGKLFQNHWNKTKKNFQNAWMVNCNTITSLSVCKHAEGTAYGKCSRSWTWLHGIIYLGVDVNNSLCICLQVPNVDIVLLDLCTFGAIGTLSYT